jgi:hypothetical protein
MIPDIIGQTTGRFDRRFFLTALVPTAVFAPATALVLLVSTDQLSTLLRWYSRLSPVSQVLAWLTVAGGIWFLATLLATQSGGIVRIYEGYPLVWCAARVNRLLRGKLVVDPPGIGAHQRRWHRLRTQARDAADDPEAAADQAGSRYEIDAADMLYDQYPARHARVMPTAFGNVIRSAEDYAHHRYGFDVIQLWPRLSVVLPNEYLVDVETSMIEYETPLMVSFGMATVAASSLLLMFSTVSTGAFVAIIVGTSIASWIAYRLSVRAVRDYGDLLRTAVDLYRTDLLEKWWPELLAVDDDRRRLAALREFVITGKKPRLEHPGPAEPPAGGLIVVGGARGGDGRGGADEDEDGDRDDSGDDGEEDLDSIETTRAQRLWVWASGGVVIACLVGACVLNEPRPVFVARDDIAAFSHLGDPFVDSDSIRRGSMGQGAVTPADDGDLPDEVDGSLVLRDIPAGAVIRSSDLAPAMTRSGVVVELVQPASQVDALDLRPGDRVLLDGNDDSGSEVCPSSASYVSGDVLALRDGPSIDQASVLVRVSRLHAQRCLGDFGGVQILRATD